MSNTRPQQLQCDLFCQVIDNFGDIGICWRLARQLQQEHHWSIRLFVDNLYTLSRLNPNINPEKTEQVEQNIQIIHWTKDLAPTELGQVVIEVFACNLPNLTIQAMAKSTPAPIWINLEYFSAEPWVNEFHLQPSFHPHLGLRKTFFFPGFSQKSGGLILEKTLFEQRQHFLSTFNPEQWWQTTFGIAAPAPERTLISLFSYHNLAISSLIAAWQHQAITLIIPFGQISQNIASFLHLPDLQIGKKYQVNQLEIISVPFIEQTAYDRLLWQCDLNFVRGEDSFVRAQWAGKPFIWHIYPQQDDAHFIKLNAVLTHYVAELAPEIAMTIKETFLAWNQQQGFNWHHFWSNSAILQKHAEKWAQKCAEKGNLTQKLVDFVYSQLK